MKVKVAIDSLKHDGKLCDIGDELDLKNKQAGQLIASGAVVKKAVVKKPAEEKAAKEKAAKEEAK